MKRLLMTLAFCLASFATFGEEVAPTNRPTTWAKPLQQIGVPNFNQITTNLYRSAQPTDEGMQNLKKMGIRTVINLRSFNSDRSEIGLSGLAYEHIYMKAWHPEEKEAIRFLQIVTDEKRLPILFHCQHGADRTGIMCALYRVAAQGWTKTEALRELKEGGYGFHNVWANLPPWFEKLDIEAIKKAAGISTPTPTPAATPKGPGTEP